LAFAWGHANAKPQAAGEFAMADTHGEHAHAGPSFQAYMIVFGALCVCTAVSFLSNHLVGTGTLTPHTSMAIIMVVAVIKATLVAGIFMHLKFDWGKLYCIILPVCIVTVMMVIILSIDATLAWHAYPQSSVPSILQE
jgi:caa(3)-type oxidase subunit IV